MKYGILDKLSIRSKFSRNFQAFSQALIHAFQAHA